MRNDEYRRLYEACLAMAVQSTDADVRARWLAMAEEAAKQFEIEPARKNRPKRITKESVNDEIRC
jgi:hypothetical protein